LSLRRLVLALVHRPQRRLLGKLAKRLANSRPLLCPCCGVAGRFEPRVTPLDPPRFDARCPRCGSYERHRLLALALDELDLLRPDDELIHFAPERPVKRLVAARVARYVAADISGQGVDRREDLQALTLGDASIDVVLAMDVLEHVPDDRRAFLEVARVLRPGGRLVLHVPMIEAWASTYEDASITTPAERTLHFGQDDHVRIYGRDIFARIAAAGLDPDSFQATPQACLRHGLTKGDRILIGSKGL
jgi:SAM-dependent methyltransferase